MPRADRRIQLLDIAREIILAQGVGALTMETLAGRAGTSKPIVYRHFANREAVAIALLDEHFAASTAYVTERVDAAGSIYEYLDIAIDCLFDIQAMRRFNPRSITNGFSASSTVNQAYLLNHQRAHEVFRGLIHQQIVDEAIAEVAAYTLMVMVQDTVWQYADRAVALDRTTLKRMVNGALHSLLPDEGMKPTTPADVLEAAARDRAARILASSRKRG